MLEMEACEVCAYFEPEEDGKCGTCGRNRKRKNKDWWCRWFVHRRYRKKGEK
ncbi:MAG: hypothetical protein II333_04310 [Clostridia bacterium]|nr:hypothetical protein [Clostridia bacterium]